MANTYCSHFSIDGAKLCGSDLTGHHEMIKDGPCDASTYVLPYGTIFPLNNTLCPDQQVLTQLGTYDEVDASLWTSPTQTSNMVPGQNIVACDFNRSFGPENASFSQNESVIEHPAHSATRPEGNVRVNLAPCAICKKLQKNESDAKKHALQHTKPFGCGEAGCTDKDGFATKSDVERHRKSVHRLQPRVGSKGWFVCPVAGCAKGAKTWARLDNLRSHIRRAHPTDGGRLIGQVEAGKTLRAKN